MSQVIIMRSVAWKRCFSFAGLVPLGIYTVVHLINNNYSVRGPAAFDEHLLESRALPAYIPLTILFIYAPLLFHLIWGLLAVRTAAPNTTRYPYFRNLKYFLQRFSGVGLALFIPAHVYKTRIEPSLKGEKMNFAHMSEGLHEPLTFVIYLLGITAVAYHLANGLWTASITWGIATGAKGQRRIEWLSITVGLVVWVLALDAVRGFFLY